MYNSPFSIQISLFEVKGLDVERTFESFKLLSRCNSFQLQGHQQEEASLLFLILVVSNSSQELGTLAMCDKAYLLSFFLLHPLLTHVEQFNNELEIRVSLKLLNHAHLKRSLKRDVGLLQGGIRDLRWDPCWWSLMRKLDFFFNHQFKITISSIKFW